MAGTVNANIPAPYELAYEPPPSSQDIEFSGTLFFTNSAIAANSGPEKSALPFLINSFLEALNRHAK